MMYGKVDDGSYGGGDGMIGFESKFVMSEELASGWGGG